MCSLKSLLIRAVIGSCMFAAAHMWIEPAQAALVTQFDVNGENADVDFRGLGHVDGAFDQNGLLALGQFQPLPRVFPSVAEVAGPWRRCNQDTFDLLGLERFAESGHPFLQSAAFSFHARAPVAPVPLPAAVIFFGSGLCGIVGIVIRRQGPLKRQDVGFETGIPQTEQVSSSVVFLVSSDKTFADGIAQQLQRSGYQFHSIPSVTELLEGAQQRQPALILIDRRITDWDMLRTDRALSHVPVITLAPSEMTATDGDLIEDLERGADGAYSFRDGHRLFLAVIGAYFRRAGHECSRRGVYHAGAVELDTDLHEVRIGGQRVPLSAKPFALLETFMRAPSKVYSRSELLDLVWGPNFAIGDHTLDVHIYALRRLLDQDPDHFCRLIAIKGVGFKLKVLQPSIPAPFRAELPKVSGMPVRRSGAVHAPVAQALAMASPGRTQRVPFGRVSRRRTRAYAGTGIVRRAYDAVSVE